MNDYVKRSDVINYVCQFCKDQHADELCDQWDVCQLFTRISNVPSADVVEQKHGEWEETKIYDGFSYFTIYKDTECGYEVSRKSNYCPWCGAKMKMEEDDE